MIEEKEQLIVDGIELNLIKRREKQRQINELRHEIDRIQRENTSCAILVFLIIIILLIIIYNR